jgi:bifunctional ADP-heptose synthase (sugar kinase/adenylyltransferase)
VAYLASELSRNKNLTEAAKVAIEAAGISVKHNGVYRVKRDEL